MNRNLIVVVFACCLLTCQAAAGGLYDNFFTGKTMRVDYYHTGAKGEERIALDEVMEEGAWPGSRVNLVDTLNLGEYLVKVSDRATNLLLYSRGYSTVFNEWQTTDEAEHMTRTFSESVRFPFPRRDVHVTILRRDKLMDFHEIFSTTINPGDPTQVRFAWTRPHYPVSTLMENGDPAEKVDILILGDGYTAGEMEKFRKDAQRLNEIMFSTQPFKEHKKEFNVRRMDVPSEESGIDVPDKGIWKRHALGAHYNTFGVPRYVLTLENKTLRDIAGTAPYDFLCILINDTRYGGGGIYNLYSTTYTGERVRGQEWQEDYMYVHEFGHSFGGLADEYYTATTAYNDLYLPGIEPWEPNITALTNPGKVKWSALLTPGIPIPTPWDKSEYDSLEAVRAKFDRLAPDYYSKRDPVMKEESRILKSSRYAGKVGVFEGAGYASRGLFRPAVDCRMFSLSLADFDPVCSAAIERMIGFYASGGK
jgi:hypothetical protein